MLPVADQRARILVVEDISSQAELLRIFLAGQGHDVRIASTAGEALTAADEWEPDGLLIDVDLPDFNGLELLRRLREAGNNAVIVLVTASSSMEMAKQAIHAGAEDFVVKPYNRDRLGLTLRNALEKRNLARRQIEVESQLSETRMRLQDAEARIDRKGFAGFIGASRKMRAIYDVIEGVAPSKASVFITGESGTGNELAAEALHRASPRGSKKFIALNCGAIPRDLLESEVFGHVRGAFTGATSDRVGAAKLADGGTLFLDEIGEMPLEMQVKLLRFVQTGTFSPVGSSRIERVDVRFVCATNRDPMLEVKAGRFREDLYYRLYVVPLELPPLRERSTDVQLIARHFLTQFSREENRRFRGFSPEAEQILMAYPWPGNVRQLQNVIRNIVVLHDAEIVTPAMIPPPVDRAMRSNPSPNRRAAEPVLEPAVPANGAGAAADATAIVLATPAPSFPPPAPDPRPVEHAGSDASDVEPPVLAEPLFAGPDFAPARPSYQPIQTPAPAVAAENPRVPQIEIMPLAEMERRLILAAIAHTDNDIPRAAALLQVNPSTVYRKVSAWRKEGLLP